MSSLCFLLPGHGHKPIGGHKVVYEYANRFYKDGNKVKIIYGASCLFSKMTFLVKIFAICRFIYFKFTKKYVPYNWFDLDKNIEIMYTWDLDEKHIKSEIVFATSIETSIYLNNYASIKNQDKYYLVQGYEDWNWGEKLLLETWAFNLNIIVVSNWLLDLVKRINPKARLIENGFDFKTFGIDNPIKARKATNVVMLYHKTYSKGFDDGINALKLVKNEVSHLSVKLFGTSKYPKNLPKWCSYSQLPNKKELREIYNNAAIFVGTSHNEGWGLTIGEAMQCGCAIACTNNKGYLIMAHSEVTALLSPIKNPLILSKNIIRLIKDEDIRLKIANSGNENIQRYTWENSFTKFKEIIENR